MIDRSHFVKLAGSCAAHLSLFAGIDARAFAQSASRPVVVEQPWGRIEKIADGVWAVISTPVAGGPDAPRTLCHGGIVAGKSGVAIVEGFASPDGAKWIAEQTKQITGRPATHVILTHFHGDHAAGLPGYRDAGSFQYVTTTETRGRLKGGVA